MAQLTISSSNDVPAGAAAACVSPGNGQKGLPPTDVPYGMTYLQGLGDGTSSGYTAGLMQGYEIGMEVGRSEGDDDGYNQGRLSSFVVGYQIGDIRYGQGYADGAAAGQISGQTQGYAIGRAVGRTDAEDDAYNQGLNDSFPVGFQAGQASVVIGGGDATAPTITIVYPPAGATIGQSTVIVFRYADETGLRRPLPCARFLQPDGSHRYELIHDGDNFTPDYQGTRSVISSAPAIIEYAVTRRGGWGATLSYHGGSPTLVPFGTDTSGNEPA